MQSIDSVTSLFARRSLTSVESLLSQSAERLSSGLRINRAKEDAAGLGISQELQRQTRAFAMATRNANDAISMVQTAEGSLQSVSELLIRLKELSTQGVNESLSKEQRSGITAEMAQLRDEINAITERTTFNSLKLLRGDFSHIVPREFVNKLGDIEGGTLSVEANATFAVGKKSSSSLAGASILELTSLGTTAAAEGTYKFSNNAEKVILTRTLGGISETQTLTLTRTGSPDGQTVLIPTSAGDSFTLNFDKFGVQATFKIDTLGSRKSAEDFAALVSSVGQIPTPKGWQKVGGADFASGASTDQVLATVTSTGGNLRISQTSGLGSVDGYAGSWTLGTASAIGFTGTVEDVNAALKTLEVDATDGIGNIDIAIAGQFGNSGFSDTNIISTSGTKDTIAGWEIYRQRVELGETIIGGKQSSNADNAAPSGAANYSTTALNSGTFAWTSSTDTASNSGTSLKLYSTGLSITGYGVVHGPYVISRDSISISVGDSVSFKWRAEKDEDYYDAYAYLLNVDTGNQIELIDSTGVTTSWATVTQPINTEGNYKFVFIAGTFDATGGTAAGGMLFLDDIQVVSSTPKPGTTKVLNVASGGSFTVDQALEITGTSTSGVGDFSARDGIYKLSADAIARSVTLNHYDEDGVSLLRSETMKQDEALDSQRSRTLRFEQLGVSVELRNSSSEMIRFGDAKSGLGSEVIVTQNRRASLIGENGPSFQTGEASRSEFSIDSFKDMRLGKNDDAQHGVLFNKVDSLITAMSASSDPDTALFQELENRVEGVIEAVATQRAGFGAIQNRLASAINNIQEQFVNLSSAKSQIQDTDFAWETARLTRLQIGQQAATAMLAQANAIPNVILALME